MIRRNSRAQPTDATNEAADRALTREASGDDFDSPDLPDVLQAESGADMEPAVPVRLVDVDGPLGVEPVPTRLEVSRSFPLGQTALARMILPENPLRVRLTMWATGADVVFAETMGECNAFTGAVLSAGLAVPHHFGFLTGLYARAASGAAEDAVLNVVSEVRAR